MHLHALGRDDALDFGQHQRADEQRHHDVRLVLLRGRERQFGQLGVGVQGGVQHPRKGRLGDFLLVERHRQSALHNVERALGGAAVVGRIVEDALGHAIGADVFAEIGIAVGRQADFAGQALLVQHQSVGRDDAALGHLDVLEIIVEELLNAPVDGRLMAGEQARLFSEAVDKIFGQCDELGIGEFGNGVVFVVKQRLAKRSKLKVDVLDHVLAVLLVRLEFFYLITFHSI